ncbi:YpmS family protein [Liquorilactobacillus mali]|uniref:YpmS family protein n=1 Tax=Liquorilactobacillus mali TaxID=1618 RepID=UPI0029543C7C|nr:YpmS family protein [Liquorilactobacillus mali]MDV7756895.1 DUF2140 family protein [Liquorilactobacillus mali]
MSELKRPKKIKKKAKINYWKWAFVVLTALVLGTALFVYKQVTTQSVEQKEVTAKTAKTGKYTTINVEMNRKQLNGTINYYLKKQQQKNNIKYRFYVSDSAAIMVGTTQILGQNVSFSLYTTPKVTKDGNIVLLAKGVGIGSLNAPPSFILNYVKKHYKLNKGITIDAKHDKIGLNLNKFATARGISIKAKTINLKNNDFHFTLSIPLK